MTRPVRFGPADSGTTIAALDRADPPTFDGAVTLSSWRESEVGGVRVWETDAPAGYARSLFAAGRRVPRPRFPREGYLRIADQPGLDLAHDWIDTLFEGSDSFVYRDGDAWRFHDLEQVEAVVPHYWVEERMPLVEIDEARRTVRSSRRSIFALRDDLVKRFARYYWDNVFETLGDQPGQWYFDRQRNRVLYVPREEDRLKTFQAQLPVLSQFVLVTGRPESGEYVRDFTLQGLRFVHADWQHPARSSPPFQIPQDDELPAVSYASAPQAAANVDAAIELVGVRDSAVRGCVIERIGGYAVELGAGCQQVVVSGNEMRDLGGGGVRLGGAAVLDDPGSNQHNTIADNEIGRGGQVFPQAVGVLTCHSAYNTIAHNHIHHLFYSGVSVGWVWGYGDNPSRGNLIADNHIHHLGAGILNDMGGVYLLGVQPGTIVRGNLIHDVECANYGGWGIYLDQGSSYVLVEGNVCHDVSSQCFHLHFGRENILRDNVFAFGRQGQVEITLIEDHLSFSLERNILVGAGVPAISGRAGSSNVRDYRIDSDHNLFWDVTGQVQIAGNIRRETSGDKAGRWWVEETVSREEWEGLGHDRHSVVADPEFVDVVARCFAVKPTSPATELGVHVPGLRGVGIRPAEERA
jgi:hypothetical protein